ncbi:MAG: CRTAC1 family protein, partial [Gemmataceae bacterium]
IGPRFVGFGAGFIDVDCDGWEDIIINNGHVIQQHPQNFVKQPPVMFLNTERNKQRFFVERTSEAGPGFIRPQRGRGLGLGDLNNDGRTDVIFCVMNDPVTLQQHDAFQTNQWLGVKLSGSKFADVTGARLELNAGVRKLTRFAKRGTSYLSHNDERILFNTGAESPGELKVYWPSGSPKEEVFRGLKSGTYHNLQQGTGQKP